MKTFTALFLVSTFMLTACGEFKSINKGTNEVLSNLSPYLSEQDQELAREISSIYEGDIEIRENLADVNMIDIEIEGQLAQVEIINREGFAFKLNDRLVTFEELKKEGFLETLISNQLIPLGSGFSEILGSFKDKNFKKLITSTFGLVIKGVFNFSAEKMLDKVLADVGGDLDKLKNLNNLDQTIKNEINDKIKNTVKNGAGKLIGALINGVIGRLTGGLLQLPTINQVPVQSGQPNSNVQTPNSSGILGGCDNLFCNLLGLFGIA